jgi:glycosyltransferase involved in cell wall biosynthesis
MTKVSVIIKTFNEEENIAKAIESSLAAVAAHDGEVIVADSGSTDRTVEIAGQYPIIVAQLLNPQERCCGVGPQLGYQHCRGDYIYILDGDMELDADFLNIALEHLGNEPRTAGVGGFVREMRIANIEFESRVKRQARRQAKHGSNVKCLNGGGLYRRSAINDVAYFSDRNLHSYEEFDLGMRLQTKGWKVLRLDNHAADHFGYTFSTYRLLWYRARSGYIFGGGELLRAAISGKYLRKALTGLPGLRPALFIWIYWVIAILISLASPTTWGSIAILAGALLMPIVVMAARNRNSLQIGMHSVVLWHMNALGLVIGLMRVRRSPTERIGSRLTHSDPTSALR